MSVMLKELVEFKVGHGHTGAVNVALALAPGHPIQPAHVNTSSSPQRRGEDHAIVALGHLTQVSSIIAHVEAAITAPLTHPRVGLAGVLVVRDGEGLVSVDLTSSWTHETLVIVESIGLTASTITIVPVTIASIAGVEGAGDGVLVPLHHIVLWTPDVVAVVSIAVVVSISRIVARHVNKVRGSIAVTGNIAQVKLVGKVLLIQWQLCIHVTGPPILTSVGEVEPGVSSQSEPIVKNINAASRPVWSHHPDISIPTDVDRSKTLGVERSDESEDSQG